jgi:hypothetical protein
MITEIRIDIIPLFYIYRNNANIGLKNMYEFISRAFLEKLTSAQYLSCNLKAYYSPSGIYHPLAPQAHVHAVFLSPLPSPSRWKQYGPPKCWYPTITLHGATTRNSHGIPFTRSRHWTQS